MERILTTADTSTRTSMIEYGTLCAFARRALAKHDPSHGIEHSRVVLTNLFALAQPFMKVARYRKIAMYAAMLHDVFDAKYEATSPVSREEMRDFLVAQLGQMDAAIVTHICANMSFTKSRKSPEKIIPFRCAIFEKIRIAVRDSDWLDRINVPRCLTYNAQRFREENDGMMPTDAQLRAIVAGVIKNEMLPVLQFLRDPRARYYAEFAVRVAQRWLDVHC